LKVRYDTSQVDAGGRDPRKRTCDKRALESDEIFVNFITGSHDAFVIEDADHILTPRANGLAFPPGAKSCSVASVYRACAK